VSKNTNSYTIELSNDEGRRRRKEQKHGVKNKKVEAKKKKARKKRTQKELTVNECIENLLAVHTLQGAWLRKLKDSIPSKKKNGR